MHVSRNRNITVNLPAELIRKAKIYAADHKTSVSAIVRELLEEALSHQNQAQAAAHRLVVLARRGPHSSVDPGSIRREDLYD